MIRLSEMTYLELKQYLVICHYACDHNEVSRVLNELQERPEYYDDDED